MLRTALYLAAALSHRQELQQLEHVPYLAFGGVGFAGVMSEGEELFDKILASPSAAADFELVFMSGNPQAKGYALVGLYRKNPKRFEELVQSPVVRNQSILTMQGCLVSRISIDQLVQSIPFGLYKYPTVIDLAK